MHYTSFKVNKVFVAKASRLTSGAIYPVLEPFNEIIIIIFLQFINYRMHDRVFTTKKSFLLALKMLTQRFSFLQMSV